MTTQHPNRTGKRLSSTKQQSITSGSNTFLAGVIEHVATDAIRPYERDLRDHSDRQIAQIAASIREMGFLVPIVVDAANVIVAGQGRWSAARELGMPRVPVVRADHLSPARIRAFRLADNKLAEGSSFNKHEVALELKELTGLDLDFEIEITGFEIAEIDDHIALLDAIEVDPDDIVAEPHSVAVSRLGDLWLAGRHALFCGSSLEAASYEALLRGKLARAVFSDPPYNVKVSGHICGLGKVQHREFAMASGEMSDPAFVDFLAAYLTETRRFSVEGALHYVCMDAPHAWHVHEAARRAGLYFKTTCVWAKTNAGMGSLYRQQTEFVHLFKNGDERVPHVNAIQLGRYGRYRSTLWTYPGCNTFRRGRMDDLAAHPTVKPIALVADAIKDCTHRGDVVLDAFCGSGTLLLAAERTGRVGYGIELDPIFVDVALERFARISGEAVIHVESGLTFEQMREVRLAANSEAEDSAPDSEPGVREVRHV